MAIKVNGHTVIHNSRKGNFQTVNPGAYSTANRPASPSEGDVIYDTDLQSVIFWNGTEWSEASGLPDNFVEIVITSPKSSVPTYTNELYVQWEYSEIPPGVEFQSGTWLIHKEGQAATPLATNDVFEGQTGFFYPGPYEPNTKYTINVTCLFSGGVIATGITEFTTGADTAAWTSLTTYNSNDSIELANTGNAQWDTVISISMLYGGDGTQPPGQTGNGEPGGIGGASYFLQHQDTVANFLANYGSGTTFTNQNDMDAPWYPDPDEDNTNPGGQWADYVYPNAATGGTYTQVPELLARIQQYFPEHIWTPATGGAGGVRDTVDSWSGNPGAGGAGGFTITENTGVGVPATIVPAVQTATDGGTGGGGGNSTRKGGPGGKKGNGTHGAGGGGGGATSPHYSNATSGPGGAGGRGQHGFTIVRIFGVAKGTVRSATNFVTVIRTINADVEDVTDYYL